MTADLVGRLLVAADGGNGPWLTSPLLREAAAELNRLQAVEARYLWLRQRLAVSDVDMLAKREAEDVEEYNASVDIRIDGYSPPNPALTGAPRDTAGKNEA